MRTAPLGKVAKFINGKAFKPSDWETKGLPIIRIQNLTGSSDVVNYFSGNVDPKYMIRDDDILISWSASLGVYRWRGGDAVLNQHIFKVDLDEKKLDRTFFYYAVSGTVDDMVAQVHGTTMQHITKDRFEEIEIPLPPLDEQRRIADILSRADRLRRLRRTALELSGGYLQSVFLEMFGDPVENPMGWKKGSLDRIIQDTKNGFGQRENFSESGVIVLRIKDVGMGFIDYSDPRRMDLSDQDFEKYRLEDNDLLLVRVNGNPDLVGRAALFKKVNDRVVFSDHIIRVKLDLVNCHPAYVTHLLNFEYGRSQIRKVVITTAGQFTINRTGISKITIPLPPLALQQKFAGIVRQVERLRAQQREAQRQAEGLFQALLHRMFNS